jgi:threonine dehydrogenase-like Zn-dependent dehydrogenase
MRANCWHGKNELRVDTVPDPKILNQRDAIVRVSSTAICGSGTVSTRSSFLPCQQFALMTIYLSE